MTSLASMKQWQHREGIEPRILGSMATELYQYIAEPTLFELEGMTEGRPILVSILMHGNETSGLDVVQRLLGEPLARPLLLLVMNANAARTGARHLKDQPDYNRIWGGGDRPEHQMAREILEKIRELDPELVIDLHNTSGENPCYSIIHSTDPQILSIAGRFANQAVHLRNANNILSGALSDEISSLTLECGNIGDPLGIDRAFEFVKWAMTSDLSALSEPKKLTIYDSPIRLICSAPEGLRFREDLEELNFRKILIGTEIAKSVSPFNSNAMIRAEDEYGNDVTHSVLKNREGTWIIDTEVVPGLLTLNQEVVKQDCLGYLMHPKR